MDLKELTIMKKVTSRSISPENFTGEKNNGAKAVTGFNEKPSFAAGLGKGWKVSPCVLIKAHSVFTLCDIKGMGHINHIWFTCDSVFYKTLMFKGVFDNKECIDSPLGAFFLNGWGRRECVSSLPICVNPSGGFNSYFVMPFRKEALLTIENTSDIDAVLYFQIDYSFDEVNEMEMYFHAKFTHVEKLKKKQYFHFLEKIEGEGCYIGSYFAFKTDCTTWWGEGEFLFYLDDDEYPSIATTGTEDYFGGAWNFEQPKGHYHKYSTPYSGLIDVFPEDQIYVKDMEFGMYRFHINDPIYFNKNLKVEVQAIGWEEGNLVYSCLSPELMAVAYWYQK